MAYRETGCEKRGRGKAWERGRSQPIWPRLYVSLFGWGLLPPLPPRALAWYQRAVLSLLGRWRMRGALGARLGWSTSALWEKPSAEDEGAGA